MSSARNKGKKLGKNIRKNWSHKYSQNLLDYAKQSATDAIKIASKRVIQKTAEQTGNLIDNNNPGRTTKVSATSQQNISVTDKEESIGVGREIHREIYIFL